MTQMEEADTRLVAVIAQEIVCTVLVEVCPPSGLQSLP
jgi:hypothetical protein